MYGLVLNFVRVDGTSIASAIYSRYFYDAEPDMRLSNWSALSTWRQAAASFRLQKFAVA